MENKDKPYKGKIDYWVCVEAVHSMVLRRCYITGIIHGHPEFKDGKTIRTSFVEAVDGKYVYTLNSKYELGVPLEEI